MSPLRLLFRILYNSLYFLLSVILLILLLVTPADTIRQALKNDQRFHIFIITISLPVAVLVVALIYFVRLYINRSVLASIPKLWVPIEKGDVKTRIRKMIVTSLSQSAAIAFESRPRVVQAMPPLTATSQDEEKNDGRGNSTDKHCGPFGLKKATTVEDELGITLPPHRAVWGDIEHYGWSSPNSPDLPNLQYSTVISELPNLIEAKALTLAPPDPTSSASAPTLDPDATALLQRPENLGLREYLSRLAELGVLAPSQTVADFVSTYEYARYSTRPISNARFRQLMHLFAEVLRAMQPLDPAVLGGLDGADDASTDSDIDNDAPMETGPTTPRSQLSHQELRRQRSTASRATTSSASSGSNRSQIHRRRQRPTMTNRNSSQGTWAPYRTAPTTPKSKRTAASPQSSVNNFAQTRQPYSLSRGGSISSSASTSGGSGRSVIRLSERADQTELPYVLTLTDRH